MTWTPIVERTRIIPVLADIAAAIDAFPRERHSELADYAVIRSYLDSDGAVPDLEDRASGALVDAIDAFAEHSGSPALYGGAARVGWTVAHHADGGDADAACNAIDTALLRQLDGWTRDYDLISGLVGFGIYALERRSCEDQDASRERGALERRSCEDQDDSRERGALERRSCEDQDDSRERGALERGPAGEAIARAVVTGLEGYMARGWLTEPDLLPVHQRVEAPDGYVNLGLAHGLPGVIAVLARFCQSGIEPERSRVVLDSALRRLLDGSPRRPRGRFTSWQPSTHPPSTRLAWCYGDLGVAAALVHAGLAIDLPEAHDEGLALALECTERTPEEAYISDAGICHGAAGIAHLFNRMAQATGEAALQSAAVAWIDRTLAMRTDQPLAGFPANYPLDDGKRRFIPDCTMLTGAGGVALVLHAACSDVEPSWDRLLLVDMPPRS